MRFIARHCRDYLIAVGMRITPVADFPNKFLIARMLRCVRGVALGWEWEAPQRRLLPQRSLSPLALKT